MVQVIYTKEQGLKQQGGSALISLPDDVVITRPISQTVVGNTKATLSFGNLVHNPAGAGANDIDIQSKYVQFKTAAGKDFYLWFNIDGAGTDPFAEDASKTAISIAVNAADVDVANEISTEIITALQGNVPFTVEFRTQANGNNVDIISRRMGNAGNIVSDLSQFQNITAGDDSLVSATLAYAHGTGSHILSGNGVVKVEDATITDANGASFVVVKDLVENSNFGVRKIILSKLPEAVQVKSADAATEIVDLDTAGDAAQLIWNGTAWKAIYTP
jgi:hypothetical protein